MDAGHSVASSAVSKNGCSDNQADLNRMKSKGDEQLLSNNNLNRRANECRPYGLSCCGQHWRWALLLSTEQSRQVRRERAFFQSLV